MTADRSRTIAKSFLVLLALVAPVVLVLAVTSHGRLWPWLALAALGGRLAIAGYALAKRRRA